MKRNNFPLTFGCLQESLGSRLYFVYILAANFHTNLFSNYLFLPLSDLSRGRAMKKKRRCKKEAEENPKLGKERDSVKRNIFRNHRFVDDVQRSNVEGFRVPLSCIRCFR